ncbi:MAG: isochorismatase family protein [Candidatus Nanoarchaeia archaeon]|nr:isochorismatase family protein [Candidatus Nanoarchaeia archaeon]MDD5740481.1 isochorismatase family protein [Candidatus Nanoarchaeia archaeon]
MKTAIYETDVQYDFSVREGALFVRANKPKTALPYGAEERLPNIFAIHKNAIDNNYLFLGSVDRHFYEDAELIRNQGGVFDDHCMNGTWGQLRLKELEPQKDIYIRAKDGPELGIKIYTNNELEKYTEAAEKNKMHLIFEKQNYNVGTNPNFEPAFKKLLDKGLQRVIVNGFATDYCDKAAVLKMAEIRDKYQKPLEIYVVTDAIEAVNINFEGKVDPEFGNKALEEMSKAGAKLITTKQVLEGKL